MLVASPTPGLAAEWHRAMNVAAAKLAVAAGVSPAQVRQISGLRRVEIRRSADQIRRQIVALRKAAGQTEDQICETLIDEVETVDRILSGRCADQIGSEYLQICQEARRYERLHQYFDFVEAFNREYVALTDEFERCRSKLKQLNEQYDIVGERLHAVAATVSFNSPWHARRRMQASVDQLVEERHSLRALLAFTCKQLATTMDQYRRHQAKRWYFHSRTVSDFRDPSKVFISPSSLHTMTMCPHEEKRPLSPKLRDDALRLMHEWNVICEQFAGERRTMLLEHKADELRDHTLRSMLANTAPSAARDGTKNRANQAEELLNET
ncbi:hypothetical protein [Mycolicibacterium austroafricanum]|uniref:hypothetical protein n=1 Tax=Mycolicibacterium austroafricanum TaxID=39687 RepID=UPI000CF9BE8B|nr:hypothetical protein [Mycolicibacterium austroafricanum]PQP43861.1 hypothetical protein C6A88_23365 [Mycolicibacterium austroafricanum]